MSEHFACQATRQMPEVSGADMLDINTPISEVVATRRGVCQDFAHLMLAILRSNGIPARYVSGYIEAFDPELVDPAMVGAAASHAWVEG